MKFLRLLTWVECYVVLDTTILNEFLNIEGLQSTQVRIASISHDAHDAVTARHQITDIALAWQ